MLDLAFQRARTTQAPHQESTDVGMNLRMYNEFSSNKLGSTIGRHGGNLAIRALENVYIVAVKCVASMHSETQYSITPASSGSAGC